MAFNKRQVESFFERTGFHVEQGRKDMDALRKRFNKIKRELQKENRYKEIDETMIETLVMAIEIRDRAFMTIAEEGILMYVDRKKKVRQKNHAISTLYQMSKSIQDISKKLGMSPLDRLELKIENDEDDGMND